MSEKIPFALSFRQVIANGIVDTVAHKLYSVRDLVCFDKIVVYNNDTAARVINLSYQASAHQMYFYTLNPTNGQIAGTQGRFYAPGAEQLITTVMSGTVGKVFQYFVYGYVIKGKLFGD